MLGSEEMFAAYKGNSRRKARNLFSVTEVFITQVSGNSVKNNEELSIISLH